MILSVSRSIQSTPSFDPQIRDKFDKIEKQNCFIELPLISETILQRDLISYLKIEFNSCQRYISDSMLSNLSKTFHEQIDKQSQIFYLLRLVLYETYLSQKPTFNFNHLELEDILNTYIGKNKRKSNLDNVLLCSISKYI